MWLLIIFALYLVALAAMGVYCARAKGRMLGICGKREAARGRLEY